MHKLKCLFSMVVICFAWDAVAVVNPTDIMQMRGVTSAFTPQDMPLGPETEADKFFQAKREFDQNMIFIRSGGVDKVLTKMIPDVIVRDRASHEYYLQTRFTNGAISADGLISVCKSAGWSGDEFYSKCTQFFRELKKYIFINAFDVCGADRGKTGVSSSREHCINYFENMRLRADIAPVMAQQYMNKKANSQELTCWPVTKNSNKLMCFTNGTNIEYYTFKFATLDEANEYILKQEIVKNVCKILGLEYYEYVFSTGNSKDIGCVINNDGHAEPELESELQAVLSNFSIYVYAYDSNNTDKRVLTHYAWEEGKLYFSDTKEDLKRRIGGESSYIVKREEGPYHVNDAEVQALYGYAERYIARCKNGTNTTDATCNLFNHNNVEFILQMRQDASLRNRIQQAYKKFAPPQQSFNDFVKMFADVSDFDTKVQQWNAEYGDEIYAARKARIAEINSRLNLLNSKVYNATNDTEKVKTWWGDLNGKQETEQDKLIAEKEYLQSLPAYPYSVRVDSDALATIDSVRNAVAKIQTNNNPNENVRDIDPVKATKQLGKSYAANVIGDATVNKIINYNVSDAALQKNAKDTYNAIRRSIEQSSWFKRDFETLSENEKAQFATYIIDKLYDSKHVLYDRPKVIMTNDMKELTNGVYYSEDHVIKLHTDNLLYKSDFIDTVVHEATHSLQYVAPEVSAMGGYTEKGTSAFGYFNTPWGEVEQNNIQIPNNYQMYRDNTKEREAWANGSHISNEM